MINQNEKLTNLGKTIINHSNNEYELSFLFVLVKFVKGSEVGSKNYIENNVSGVIRYLRVGDLIQLGNTFVENKEDYPIATAEDILIAFDGAPGRNSFGIDGVYSSGIYKVVGNSKYKGLVYFELNSDLNKKIISDHSQGTTILHASKAIPHLKYAKVDDDTLNKLNIIFEQLLSNKKKIKNLQMVKSNLLSKYF